mmetsp:Transcript_18966/g.48649  ORF Transcript_18966/g.48649 Transcript_18966/m.48649 type:complete len:437 (+) Transcript_18966:1003-2313(+)
MQRAHGPAQGQLVRLEDHRQPVGANDPGAQRLVEEHVEPYEGLAILAVHHHLQRRHPISRVRSHGHDRVDAQSLVQVLQRGRDIPEGQGCQGLLVCQPRGNGLNELGRGVVRSLCLTDAPVQQEEVPTGFVHVRTLWRQHQCLAEVFEGPLRLAQLAPAAASHEASLHRARGDGCEHRRAHLRSLAVSPQLAEHLCLQGEMPRHGLGACLVRVAPSVVLQDVHGILRPPQAAQAGCEEVSCAQRDLRARDERLLLHGVKVLHGIYHELRRSAGILPAHVLRAIDLLRTRSACEHDCAVYPRLRTRWLDAHSFGEAADSRLELVALGLDDAACDLHCVLCRLIFGVDRKCLAAVDHCLLPPAEVTKRQRAQDIEQRWHLGHLLWWVSCCELKVCLALHREVKVLALCKLLPPMRHLARNGPARLLWALGRPIDARRL